MFENSTALCPCQSGLALVDCCAKYHLQQVIPDTAEQLMRSRYTAYVLKNIAYIQQTTVPAQQNLLNLNELTAWAENTHWVGLQILQHNILSKQHSAVEFKAFFMQEGEIREHKEKSLFVKIEGRWYFVDPTVPLPTMKQPCICHSGKKFKHCCGGLL